MGQVWQWNVDLFTFLQIPPIQRRQLVMELPGAALKKRVHHVSPAPDRKVSDEWADVRDLAANRQARLNFGVHTTPLLKYFKDPIACSSSPARRKSKSTPTVSKNSSKAKTSSSSSRTST